jgi:hypothetical protein
MSTEVIIGPARLLWSDLETPSEMSGKYGVKLGLPKSADMGELRAAITAAKSRLSNPKGARLPVTNGDQSDHESENGYWVVRAVTKFQPACFNSDNTRIGVEDLYAGCMVRVKVKVYDYNYKGQTGVGLQLGLCQFAGKGERLGGSMDVEPPGVLAGVEPLRPSSSDGYSDYPPDDEPEFDSTEIPF